MEKKRVLVIGGGAREHAILWRLLQDGNCILSIWPGNAGTMEWNVELDPERLVDSIVELKADHGLDYVVIGPEAFLAQGLVDKLAEKGILAFGPSAAAARLESEKDFALAVILEAGVPHPKSWVFSNPGAVTTHARSYGRPVAIKPRGLTGGKGVKLCFSPEEAEKAAYLCGELYPGEPIVVQELLKGQEVTVLAFVDKHGNISPLVAACDYKTFSKGGPNTGGIGSYAWPRGWSKQLEKWTLEWVIKPIVRRMALRGTPFVGMLYVGLMLTEDGPKVLEFNVRFGDPEAQVVLPLLQGDLLEIMLACTQGRLDQVKVFWNRRRHTVAVVINSKGYPGAYLSGFPITLNGEYPRNVHVFHASTTMEDGVLVTDDKSGRVLTIVGVGSTREEARQAAYDEVANVKFENAMHRPDVALLV